MKRKVENESSLFPQIEQCESLTIKFDTPKHSIDAGVVGAALVALKQTVEHISTDRPEIEEAKVEVKSISPGCIEVGTLLAVFLSIANPETLTYIANNIKDLFSFYKFLKGKRAQKIKKANEEQKQVTNASGDTMIFNNCVINYYNHSTVSPLGDLSALNETGTKSVSIRTGSGEELVRINDGEYSCFGKRPPIEESDLERIEEEEVELTISMIPISKPEKGTWGFIHGGDQIKARILDNEFTQKINDHVLSFHKGDKMRAIVRKQLVFSEKQNCFVTKKRQILSVLEFFQYKQPKQAPLLP